MRKVIKDICDVPKNNKGLFLWKECVGDKILLDDSELIIDHYNTSNRTFGIMYGEILFFMTYVEFKKMLIEHKVNRIPFTHPIINNYFIGGIREAINYSHGSTKDVNMRCPYCNRKRIYKPSYITRKGFMPCICNRKGMSYPEIVMFYLLEYCNEDFDREVRFDWCNFQMRNYNTYGLFDFVLSHKKIIIEMDGGFHDDEDVLLRDKHKDNLATKNGFKVIRIDSRKSDIKFLKNNIENSELSLYLNLSNVVWEDIEMKARSNIYKEICEFKVKNPNAFVSDIAKHFKLKNDFIRSALKNGNDIGWCVCKHSVGRQTFQSAYLIILFLVVQGFSPTANWIWFTKITHSEFTPIILTLFSLADISSPNDQIFLLKPSIHGGISLSFTDFAIRWY